MTGTSRPPGRALRLRPGTMMRERIVHYWRTVIRCWRTAFDWTVLLYIVVPVLWMIGGVYRDLWLHPPLWLSALPAALPVALLALVSTLGRLRTFAEPGDGLFLRRNRTWTRRMTAAGLAYTFAGRVPIVALALIPALPVLVKGHGWTATEATALAALAAASAWVWVLGRDLVERAAFGWRKGALIGIGRIVWIVLFEWLPQPAASGGPATAVWAAAVAAAVAIAAALSLRRLRARGTFQHEVETEREAFSSSIGWLLQDAIERKPLPRTKRPWLFPRSGRLFRSPEPPVRLAELWLKSYMRKPDIVRMYYGLSALGLSAVLRTPPALAVLVAGALVLLVLTWLNRLWQQWLAEPYIALFRRSDAQRGTDPAAERGRFAAALPPALLWTLAVGIRLGAERDGAWWAAAPVLAAAGWLFLRAANRAVSAWSAFRRGRARKENRPSAA